MAWWRKGRKLDLNNYIMIDNLKHHRWCVFGMPRTGSHLLEYQLHKHLNEVYGDSAKLGELFHPFSIRDTEVYLEGDTIISNDRDYDAGEFQSVNFWEEVYRKIGLLSQADNFQPLSCRFFYGEQYIFLGLEKTISILQENNFKFIRLDRDFEKRLISYYFAKTNDNWRYSKNENKLFVDISRMRRYIFQTVHTELDYESQLPKFEYIKMDYDDIPKDGAGKNVKVLPDDPYEHIENAAEVKQLFDEYYPKVRDTLRELI